MMATEYEVVGVIDTTAAGRAEFGGETILVENDDPDKRLICQPKGSADDG